MSRMFEKSLFPLLVLMAGTLFSCQRKAEEPVVSPGAGRGQVWFEVSERPMGGETKAAPATIETFTTSHESFGVVGYAYASGDPSSKTKVRDTMQVSYVSERERWEPATPVKYSLAGSSLEFYAWYPYNTTTVPVTAPPEIDDTSIDPTHPTITYTVPPAVANQKDLMVAKASGVTDSPSTDAPVELTFSHMLTAVKFSIGVGITCFSITLEGIPDTGILDMSTGEWSLVDNTPATYTITSPAFGSWDANVQRPIADSLTLMLIPQTLSANATLTAETSAGTFSASLAGQEWKAGKMVIYKLTDPAASFSVSATKKVRFSPGNLQYTKSARIWSFMDHQYSTVEANQTPIGIDYAMKDVVSLFGWGTSGHKFASGYGYAYQPWSTRNDYPSYYGPTDGTFDLTGEYAEGDWGVNMGSGWRTLTKDEWNWLLGLNSPPNPGTNCRRSSTVSGTENARFAMAYLFGSVHGLIIFPDSYTHPDGVAAPYGINEGGADAWNSNRYNATEWAKMESAGCVFLPAAGSRDGTSVQYVGSTGYYWSSSHHNTNTDFAQALSFNMYAMNPVVGTLRCRGVSVRLVQDL